MHEDSVMRYFIGFVVLVALLAGPAGGVARAASIEDLVNLRANGVSDDVLIALIQTDGSIFHLSSNDILTLRKRGLSNDVVLAMLQTARPAQASIPSVGPAQDLTQPRRGAGNRSERFPSD